MTSAAEPVELEAVPGEVLELAWDREVVPVEALERTLYAMANQLTGAVTSRGSEWILQVYPRGPVKDRQSLEHLIRQTVNDNTLRVRIAERTDPLRNLVFALAFSRSGLVDGNTSHDA